MILVKLYVVLKNITLYFTVLKNFKLIIFCLSSFHVLSCEASGKPINSKLHCGLVTLVSVPDFPNCSE